jgi:hypothetical protein
MEEENKQMENKEVDGGFREGGVNGLCFLVFFRPNSGFVMSNTRRGEGVNCTLW